MENWEIERENFIKICKDHPPYGSNGNRGQLITKACNDRWRRNMVLCIEKIIKNDTDDKFYSMGIFKYNWTVTTTYKIMKKEYYEYDITHDNVIIPNVLNGNIIQINDIIKAFKLHYTDFSDNIFYIQSVHDDILLKLLGEKYNFIPDDNILPYKKIGKTTLMEIRFQKLKLIVPHDINPIKMWEIQADKLTFVEEHMKKFLKPYNRKGEFFIDPNNTLITIVSEELKHLSTVHNILIQEKN